MMIYNNYSCKMSMFRRQYEADPPVYTVHFKLHYSVKQGQAVYININGSVRRMAYQRDQHGDIWTHTERFSPMYMSNDIHKNYYYFVAKFFNEKNITGTVCYENSQDIIERYLSIYWGYNLYVEDWCHDRNKNIVWNEFGKIVN